jgi:PKD repeat protein
MFYRKVNKKPHTKMIVDINSNKHTRSLKGKWRITLIIFVLSASNVVTGQPLSFTSAPASPISNVASQRGFFSKDLNNDGIKDLIIGNAYSTNLYVLIGLGTGQFTNAPGSPITGVNGPIYNVSADFNNDGVQDIASANYGGSNISVFLGTGNGSFNAAAGSPFNSGSLPYCIDAADFNMDGFKDLITCNAGSNNVVLFLGNGTGSFVIASGFPLSASGAPYHVLAGMFNADAFPDFAFVNGNGNNMNVYLGNGSGSFTQATGSPYSTGGGSQPRTLTSGDLNNDGATDLVITNLSSNDLVILLGSASGTFTPAASSPIAVGFGPYQSAIADFNSDGNADIVTSVYMGNAMSVRYGNGNGGFTTPSGSPFSSPGSPQPVVTADFNGDNKPDLAIGDWYGTNINILINNITTCSVNASFNAITTGSVVNFTSTTSGTTSSSSYTWNFGDNSALGSGAFASHTYTASGTYIVALQVSNSITGCTSIVTKIISICLLNTAFNFTLMNAGNVAFTSGSTGTVQNSSYTWNFGHGSATAQGASASYTYPSGIYIVTLTVSNNAVPPCVNTSTQTIRVCNFAISFSYTVTAGGVVNFSGTSTGGSGTTYSWNFGNGAGSQSGLITSSTYTNAGIYTVTLTAIDPVVTDCNRTFTTNVVIPAKPTGINELTGEEIVGLFPNPASDEIVLIAPEISGVYSVIFYNSVSQSEIDVSMVSPGTMISTRQFATGIYFYRILDNQKTLFTGKLLLIR